MIRPVALVTGAHRGIGRAVAVAFAAVGFDVAITDLAEEADETRAACERHGARTAYERFDLADLAAHEPALERIEAALGPVAVLVNNAGRGAVVRGDLLALTPENFDAVLAVNLRGTVFLTQAVVRRLLAREAAGHPRAVVTITSFSAGAASPERLDYCISKAGLSMFVQGLALRLAETDVRVFEIRPGIIRTDMTAGVAEKYDRLIEGGLVPQKRWGEPEDVAAAAVALATGGGFGFSQGQVVEVGGGLGIPRL